MKIDKGSFINDFINKNLRQYSIPVYQRNYEWSAEQCEKLFEDIIQAHEQDRYHFTGSVVYELLKTENKIDYYVVIDGQQRLTTIYILLKALIDVANSDSEKAELRSLMFNEDKFKKYNIDDSSKLKLKPIKSDNQQLMLLMEDHPEKMDKSSGIYQNYELFCSLARKALEGDDGLTIEKIYDGIEHLTCAMIKLEDEERGKEQEIFERINSTGVPLSLADKIRNFVLMTEMDQERLYEDYWLKIEQILSKDEMVAFFLDYLNLKLDGFTREKEAYDNFKLLFRNGKYSNESMLSELLHYAEQYRIFLAGTDELGADVNKALTGLRQLKQTTVYLFLFKVFDDFEKRIITEKTLSKVLNLLLNYSIRRLICEVGSNSLRGLYKTLYSRVFNREENRNYYYDAIVSFLTQMSSKDAIPSDEEFILALKEKNLYRKNALCKFLLVAVENQSKEKVQTADLSIEHIMPQNKNLSKSWQNMLGDDWERVHERYLHTLGNLTLTGYNSELGDKSFEEKKQMLENPETPTHITVLYGNVLGRTIWDEKAIRERAAHLSELILKLFPIDKAEEKIDFSDPRYQEYRVTDSRTATFKQVNYYELLGERVNVESFAAMVRSVAVKLYDMDSTVIECMARGNEALPGWQNPVFSYDQGALKGGVEFKKGTGIYISTGYSAYDCISFIRGLLKKHDLNIDEDFVYSARSTKGESDDTP
ncbi:DUF262 domain-containing protein [Vermiculatibacterium agrestimuris]|uniref:DUF262 domain-containing protein n=1 Tax=Vermiculatibacterium agrestimuris TaxID=2941519 RepID=UPI00203B73A9|nr:DUF262 domain-containing protein [Vermiculatibacterium agrestimuris]